MTGELIRDPVDIANRIEAAIDLLGAPPSDRDYARTCLMLFVAEHGVLAAPPVAPSEAVTAMEGLAADCASIEARLTLLHRAKMTSSETSYRGLLLRHAYAEVCERLAGHEFDWDERRLIDAPLAGRYTRAAIHILAIAARFRNSVDDAQARQPNPGTSALIMRLGELWMKYRQCLPRAPDNSSTVGYRSPFARLVDAIWPVVSDRRAPSNATIRRSISGFCSPERSPQKTECQAP